MSCQRPRLSYWCRKPDVFFFFFPTFIQLWLDGCFCHLKDSRSFTLISRQNQNPTETKQACACSEKEETPPVRMLMVRAVHIGTTRMLLSLALCASSISAKRLWTIRSGKGEWKPVHFVCKAVFHLCLVTICLSFPIWSFVRLFFKK